MHVLYVHQNFPAQFGHIAAHLVREKGWRCTFVSERDPGLFDGIERIQYITRGGATKHNSYYTRTFETAVAHAEGVYRALKARSDVKPDLIVGHSGFGSTIFLPELHDCPIINMFEYYYHSRHSDMDYRHDAPINEQKILRSSIRNAMIQLDLVNCDAGYVPTGFQKSVFPGIFQPKLEVVFDGVDTGVYHRVADPPRRYLDRTIGPQTRIVTYCARGFERMRGFDMFMQAARIIYERYPDVVFLVVGTDRICYGGDEEQIGDAKSLRHYVLSRDQYDLSKFMFVGWKTPAELAAILSVGDAHIYLTVPFVLSWSMMDALACGAAVVGSDTAPVREMITDGRNGFLVSFFDPEQIAARVVEILEDPPAYRSIRENAMDFIQRDYSLDAVLPRMLDLYDRTVSAGRKARPIPEDFLKRPSAPEVG
ncbi:MAG: glycosyl transferase family 1 [Phycisphaeraceae bacterium]|nr:glycosyl transferase family 1 [Phycisphaeraceae bacterium]